MNLNIYNIKWNFGNLTALLYIIHDNFRTT